MNLVGVGCVLDCIEEALPTVLTVGSQTDVSGWQLILLKLLDDNALHYYTGLETRQIPLHSGIPWTSS